MKLLDIIIDLDKIIINFVHGNFQNPILNYLMPFISWLGNAGLVWIVLGVFLISRDKHKTTGYLSLLSILLTFILVDIVIKPIVGRPRPFLEIQYIKLLISAPSSFSFPSGHSAVAFAFANTILIMANNRLVKICMLVFASLMALSRLYLFVHYPSDILIGITTGVLVSKTVCYYYNKKKISTSKA